MFIDAIITIVVTSINIFVVTIIAIARPSLSPPVHAQHHTWEGARWPVAPYEGRLYPGSKQQTYPAALSKIHATSGSSETHAYTTHNPTFVSRVNYATWGS